MKRAVLFASLLLAGCRQDPQPVTVLSPSARPDLKSNAFLLSNNSVLGCKDWNKTAQSTKGDQILSHEEPPIEGFDGSFLVNMKAQALLGTGPSLLKTCSSHEAKDEHQPTWTLHWKMWKADGSVHKSGNEDITSLAQTQGVLGVRFEAVSGSPTLPEVAIVRTADSAGHAWTMSVTNGLAFDQSSGVPKIETQNGRFRMKEISIPQRPPVAMTDPNERGTCSAFKICHDNEDCSLPPLPPPPCNPELIKGAPKPAAGSAAHEGGNH